MELEEEEVWDDQILTNILSEKGENEQHKENSNSDNADTRITDRETTNHKNIESYT